MALILLTTISEGADLGVTFIELWHILDYSGKLADFELRSRNEPGPFRLERSAWKDFLEYRFEVWDDLTACPDLTNPLALAIELDNHLSTIWKPTTNPIQLRQFQENEYIIVRSHLLAGAHSGLTDDIRTWTPTFRVSPSSIEGKSIVYFDSPRTLSRWLDGGNSPKSILTGLATFTDGVKPIFNTTESSDFWCTGLSNENQRWQAIMLVLEEGMSRGINCLILPELSTTKNIKVKIAVWLRDHDHNFQIVVPGSYHIELNGKRYNTTELLDGLGNSIFEHRKLRPYGRADNGMENIQSGDSVPLCTTRLGVLATPICLDFSDERQRITHIWDTVRPEWFLVPAFGDNSSLSAHERAMARYKRAGSRSLIANQGNTDGTANARLFAGNTSHPKVSTESDYELSYVEYTLDTS